MAIGVDTVRVNIETVLDTAKLMPRLGVMDVEMMLSTVNLITVMGIMDIGLLVSEGSYWLWADGTPIVWASGEGISL